MSRTALIKTTTASQQDCAKFSTISSIAITAETPTGTDTRFAVKIADGNWQKYDTSAKAWADLTTQDITGASLMSEGNTKAELEALTNTALDSMAGKVVNFAVALSMEDSAEEAPTISGIEIDGKSGATVTTETIESTVFDLSDTGDAVEILSIDVEKTEENGGSITVYASTQDSGGSWTDYREYSSLVTSPATTAKAIKFKAVMTVKTPGTSVATLDSVTIKHRTDNVAVFSEGTGVCVSKTYDFRNTISRAHLMAKHPIVQDTEIKAYIALRKPPTYVEGEVLGTGTGESQTVTLAHTDALASHGFALYFDDEKQTADKYSYSPTDGKVTFTADAGVSVTVDYIYGWSAENWVAMKHDTQYPDKNDNNLVDDQYDYEAGDGDPTGSTGAIKVELTQATGKVKSEELGTGTGELQAFKLAHHAKSETIVVTPSTATWKFKENTDVLLVTAPKGEAVSVAYSWAARTNYLESLACIFNE